ncbi:MAG: hypothetical protein ACHQFX_00420 [Chitinophagales bacterium]
MKTVILNVALFFLSASCFSQGSTLSNQLDSVQKKMMRDSLQLSDSVIAEFLTEKNDYNAAVRDVRLNSTLTRVQQSDQVQALRIQANSRLKTILGTEVYERYVQMITRKMRPTTSTQ